MVECKDLLVGHGVAPQINTTPTSPTATWANLFNGWDNIAEALNEVLQQYAFLGNGGFMETFVTGMQPIMSLTGVRVLGDNAQDFIFSKRYEILCERKTDFRIMITDKDGNIETILWENITLAKIVPMGGAAQDGMAIGVDMHSSQKPEIINGQQLPAFDGLVSVAGSLSGDTAIHVNPALGSGNSYVYKTDTSVDIPLLGADLSVGWTAWNGTDEITATTGNEIVVVEVDSSNLAVKGSKATVTSKA